MGSKGGSTSESGNIQLMPDTGYNNVSSFDPAIARALAVDQANTLLAQRIQNLAPQPGLPALLQMQLNPQLLGSMLQNRVAPQFIPTPAPSAPYIEADRYVQPTNSQPTTQSTRLSGRELQALRRAGFGGRSPDQVVAATYQALLGAQNGG